MQTFYLYGPIVVAVAALIYAFVKATWVSKQDPGTEHMQKIGGWIASGAMAFLARQYRVLAIFVLSVAVLLGVSNAGLDDSHVMISLSFVVGAFCSALAGYFGMKVATKANTRTASAARTSLNGALQVAFSGGAVMGLTVVGLALAGLGVLFLFYSSFFGTTYSATDAASPLNLTLNVLSGFSLGASSIALFARVGGGIYTKAADVGADLVGKVEAGIPEDHPLNPATIADNVGDNVGDVAGMGADLFESYVGAIVSSMILGMSWYFGIAAHEGFDGMNAVYLPMVVGMVGIVASIVGTFFVKTKEGGNPQTALNFGTLVAGAIMVLGTVAALFLMLPRTGLISATNVITGVTNQFHWWGLAVAIVGGLACGMAIGFVTEYYTATHKKPVNEIVESSRTGSATAVIQGLALGMSSTTIPVLLICASILLAYFMGGLYGVALSAVGMLSTTGIQLAIDAYGPIADNSGGIAEMAKLGRDVRARTDQLDAVGNTTAAIGKGFAIGSAALTALAMTAAYITKIGESGHSLNLNAADPFVLVGLLVGCALPFRFSAMAMVAVGRAAQDMIQEVRRQFRDIPELRPALNAARQAEEQEREPNAEEQAIIDAADGKADYAHCVSIATAAAIKKMVVPGLLAVGVPVAVGLVSLEMLGGLLIGCTISGVCMAIFQSNTGGAWDNSKKQVKEGGRKEFGDAYEGMHNATVTCDTVGDPLKDTSGPSINILIKLVSVVAMIIAPLLIWFHF